MGNYRPGDIANGHVLNSELQWVPIPAAETPAQRTAVAIESELDRRSRSDKSNAWLLWLFLGGFNAHLAYIYRRQAVLIVILSLAAAVLTLGLSLFLWLVNWIPLVSGGGFHTLREHRRADVEREMLIRNSLYR